MLNQRHVLLRRYEESLSSNYEAKSTTLSVKGKGLSPASRSHLPHLAFQPGSRVFFTNPYFPFEYVAGFVKTLPTEEDPRIVIVSDDISFEYYLPHPTYSPPAKQSCWDGDTCVLLCWEKRGSLQPFWQEYFFNRV